MRSPLPVAHCANSASCSFRFELLLYVLLTFSWTCSSFWVPLVGNWTIFPDFSRFMGTVAKGERGERKGLEREKRRTLLGSSWRAPIQQRRRKLHFPQLQSKRQEILLPECEGDERRRRSAPTFLSTPYTGSRWSGIAFHSPRASCRRSIRPRYGTRKSACPGIWQVSPTECALDQPF